MWRSYVIEVLARPAIFDASIHWATLGSLRSFDASHQMVDEEELYRQKTNAKRMAGNRARPQTTEQIVNSLPPELRETMRVAQEVERREKDAVIGQILANSNVAEADKRVHYEWLSAKTGH